MPLAKKKIKKEESYIDDEDVPLSAKKKAKKDAKSAKKRKSYDDDYEDEEEDEDFKPVSFILTIKFIIYLV